MDDNDLPRWDVPGWDWQPGDYSWLDAGVRVGDTSIFFIHGGRIRHQANIKHGSYTVEEFAEMLRAHADGLDNARVEWMADTGGGDPGLWVEGTRPPRADDLARLQEARARRLRDDEQSLRSLKARRPEWFAAAPAHEKEG